MRGEAVPPVKYGLHATVRNIEGGNILPAARHGRGTQYGISSERDTYFTPIHGNGTDAQLYPEGNPEHRAWMWAEDILGHQQAGTGGRVRPRVYLTKPDSEQYVDRNAMSLGARTAPKQKIVDTLWGPSPREGGVTEQTLPHVNWKQFGAPNYTQHTPESRFLGGQEYPGTRVTTDVPHPLGPGGRESSWQPTYDFLRGPQEMPSEAPKRELPGQESLF